MSTTVPPPSKEHSTRSMSSSLRSSLSIDMATMTTTRIEDAPATTNLDFRSTSTTLQQLLGYWHRCCRHGGDNSHHHHHGDEWFHRVWELHTENSRHYHTAVHLLEMCQLFDAACSLSLVASAEEEEEIDDDDDDDDPDNNTDRNQPPPLPYHTEAILLAIFFHDAVYDATSSRNEEDSAHLFRSFAAETAAIDEATIRDVVDWIMATKTHQLSSSSLPPNPNLQLFLDLDMAVLGKTATAYAHYANLVRREYQHVPLAIYCETRATVLQNFLQQPHIYGTDLFRMALEQRARENLAHEIESLRRGSILGSTASPP